MSRNKDYQRLLNSRRWKELRVWKLQHNPLCELCQQEGGYISASVDIHHIKPVESATSLKEMEELCFNPANLMALCIPCHVKVHKEMGKSTKANHKDRSSQALARWASRHGVRAEEAEGEADPPPPDFLEGQNLPK